MTRNAALLALLLAACSGGGAGAPGVDRTYTVPSSAMAPSIVKGDRIGCTDDVPPALPRGAVVVFEAPERWAITSGATFVKRVVGLPGETVSGDATGRISVGGTPLDEPYAPPVPEAGEFDPVTVPAGEYFLVGDKRDASADSRVNGTVPHASLRGVCTRILAPKERRGRIPGT